jgi:hypothetical protein
MTHVYVPHIRYPWFCDVCGYAGHERLQHPATAREANADTGHRDRSDDPLREEKQTSSNTQKNTMGGEHGSS